MNSVSLIGRLTADPEIRYLDSGKAVAKFSIAVNRNREEADYFEVEAWEKTAEVIGQYGVWQRFVSEKDTSPESLMYQLFQRPNFRFFAFCLNRMEHGFMLELQVR
jgi:hypothetical protein